jgi:hypothetical protein
VGNPGSLFQLELEPVITLLQTELAVLGT